MPFGVVCVGFGSCSSAILTEGSVARPTITCVFCAERGPSASEDVIPRWLAKTLHLTGTPPYFDLAVEIADDEVITTGQRNIGGLPTPYKFPEVCKRCNEGWMSRLEQAMNHAAKRLIEGKHCHIDPYDQVVIATWMTKTALLYDVARGDQVVPLDDGCRRFYRLGHPLPLTQVVLGAFQTPDTRVVMPHRRKEHKLIDPATGNVTFHAIDVSFLFRFLFIQVFINWRDDAPQWFGIPGGPAAHPNLIQCWPVRQPIAWQPAFETAPPGLTSPGPEQSPAAGSEPQ